MTRSDVRQAILEIIEELVPDEDLLNLDDKKKIRDQVELDSMDFLDIIMELRKRYGINVPEDDYPHFITLEGCMNYLEPTLKNR
jgi:acyl carrier protein